MESYFLQDIPLMFIRDCIALIGVVIIALGAVRSIYQLFVLMLHRKFEPNYIRLQFGNCVILGLEFMVGADILGSLVEPNYYNIGLLAMIVVIRTVLSYFLSLELEALTPQQREAIK